MTPREALDRLLEREGTGISWAHLTMNFWIGCQEVSPACDHCYAREFTNARVNAMRAKLGLPPIVWGPGGARQQTAEANRRKPLRWNRIAAAAGVILNVFCSSLSDWADNVVPDEWRAEIADAIRATPNLRWMLLTKRIGNARAMLETMFPEGVPENVALGLTIANQQEADRDLPKAIATKQALGIKRLFVSMEPLLGFVDITRYLSSIDLVIVGGESGKHARVMLREWALAIMRRCEQARVPFHFKQWGEFAPRDGPNGVEMRRVGVRSAGHMLGGREHREHFA